MRINEITDVCW